MSPGDSTCAWFRPLVARLGQSDEEWKRVLEAVKGAGVLYLSSDTCLMVEAVGKGLKARLVHRDKPRTGWVSLKGPEDLRSSKNAKPIRDWLRKLFKKSWSEKLETVIAALQDSKLTARRKAKKTAGSSSKAEELHSKPDREEVQLSPDEEQLVEDILSGPDTVNRVKELLDDVIAGEDENKQAIFILLLSGRIQDPRMKQIILLKGTEGAGKSRLASLSYLFKVKDVGRFSEHALDYTDLRGYEVLYLKEMGHMDQERQGVSTLKFLSSEDRGYTVEVTAWDEETKTFRTKEYRIPPITLITTTTRVTLDPQFERRAWIFNPDESEDQTCLLYTSPSPRDRG